MAAFGTCISTGLVTVAQLRVMVRSALHAETSALAKSSVAVLAQEAVMGVPDASVVPPVPFPTTVMPLPVAATVPEEAPPVTETPMADPAPKVEALLT